MVIKPFSHLARQSFAKTFAHGYAQSVVAASQSSYATTAGTLGQFHSYPAHKFTRTTQLQNLFQSTSGASGPGAKAGHASQGASTNGDSGLAAYYAAWQHAQQTGDESDWRQHSFSKSIGWKSTKDTTEVKRVHRRDSSITPDSLRPLRPSADRSLSETDVNRLHISEATEAETEALQQVDHAIAQEVTSTTLKEAGKETDGSTTQTAQSGASDSLDTDQQPSVPARAAESGEISSVQTLASSLGKEILEQGRSQQYAEIPALFERMLRAGDVPTTEMYNAIIESAVHLTGNVYQALPKALEIYGDMVRRNVSPNEQTYTLLVEYLTAQARDVHAAKSMLEQKRTRFGTQSQFLLKSQELEYELLAEDSSLQYALQQYRNAKSRFPAIQFPARLYSALVQACAREGQLAEMKFVYQDMKALNLIPSGGLFVSMIKANAQAKDVVAANQCYEDYRALSVAKQLGDSSLIEQQDMIVYASLAKAFLAAENTTGAFKFLARILESYENVADSQVLKLRMETRFCSTLVEDALDRQNFAKAIEFSQARELEDTLRVQWLSKISSAAADASDIVAAKQASSLLDAQSLEGVNADAAILMANLRLGHFEDAQKLWTSLISRSTLFSSPIEVATRYVMSLLEQGHYEEATSQIRSVFLRARGSTEPSSYHLSMDQMHEAVAMLSETMCKTDPSIAVQNPRASILLLRTMMESGSLMPQVIEEVMSCIGPDCVEQLESQDIALALHMQAELLSRGLRIGSLDYEHRFAHLLNTVIDRSIPIDPFTLHAVTNGLSKLQRPDLVQKWQLFIQPRQSVESLPSPFMTPSPTSPTISTPTSSDSFDPYAHNTDYRASATIGDQLENPGRLESHLSDAMSRFRNVRRAGRHTRYTTYAKLITAAGKTGQVHLVHEIFGMARHDVPLDLQYNSVRAGWVAIFDSMVAACLTIGDRHLASKYHQEMLDMGSAPSANTFGLYITTLKESARTFDEASEAVRIFQRALTEGVEPGVFLYNAVIGKLGKARRVDDCLKFFTEMQQRNIQPTSVTYGTLVNALCRTSEETFAENMFEEMEAQSNYRPRAAPYNSIIQFFLNTKRNRSKVLSYYHRMLSLNIKPTSHTYKLMIEAHASLEPVDLASAEGVLQEMKAAGVQPEAVHYGTLIHAKGCVMHDMAGARALFDQVLASGTIRPTDNLYQNLFEAMVANHQVAETDQVLQGMSTRNVKMTPYIANTLIHGWAAQRNIAKAKAIFNELGYAKREPSTYEAMTRAFLSVEDHHGAASVVQEMLSKGYPTAVADKILVLVGGA